MKDVNAKTYYQSKDQYLATLLFCLDIPLEKTERKGSIVFFVFQNKGRCEEIIKDYYQNKLNINPKKFVDSLNTIRSLIFS